MTKDKQKRRSLGTTLEQLFIQLSKSGSPGGERREQIVCLLSLSTVLVEHENKSCMLCFVIFAGKDEDVPCVIC